LEDSGPAPLRRRHGVADPSENVSPHVLSYHISFKLRRCIGPFERRWGPKNGDAAAPPLGMWCVSGPLETRYSPRLSSHQTWSL